MFNGIGKKILIIAPHFLGDIVLSQALFQFLKKEQPDCVIDVLAHYHFASILSRMLEVNRVIGSPFIPGKLHLYHRYRLARQLRAAHYDQAILLTGTYKSALIPYLAKIPQRTGWLGEKRYGIVNDIRSMDQQSSMLCVEKFVALGYEKNISRVDFFSRPYLNPNENGIKAALMRHQLLVNQQPILVLCPGASSGKETKRWFPEYYAIVANAQLNKGWQVWILGAAQDQVVGELIAEQTNYKAINLAGKTTLAEVVDLMSLASFVITHDSGLLHVAAALNRPLIAIYGPTSAKDTPPLSENAIILQSDVPCSPCFQWRCPLQDQPMQCMRTITPEKVLHFLGVHIECPVH